MASESNENIISVLPPAQLFEKLYPRLCSFATQLLKDRELAEDVVQDTFVVYLEQREKISANDNAIKSFLYTSVKNACLNRIRHVQVVEAHQKKYASDSFMESKILENIIHAEIIAKIHEKINALPKGCALVIRYGYLEGLSNSKIAESMNISINTVKSQKKRALGLLKIHLRNAALALFILLYF
ncbi:MAG TPA: RNA polymerase sigma-70 factor [Pedobacter sp.]|nr:RNA polymerase sigma-70 factor [Pedobacter sp.]